MPTLSFRRFIIDPAVFIPAVAILLTAVVIVGLLPEESNQFLMALQSQIVINASWFYVLVMGIVLVLVFVFAFSRHGHIKLGPDHSEASYGFISWFAMLFGRTVVL